LNFETTICAVATPNGKGGIGIVKISGPDTLKICNHIFSKDKNGVKKDGLKSYWNHSVKGKNFIHGYLIDPYENFIIDEVLLALMKSPYSYTREDVIEIQSHSGPLILKKILGILIKLGAVNAEPGEFTKRAFLNGRIDLAQAESIIDLIQANNIEALKMANNTILGEFSGKISNVRNQFIDIITEMQAILEFPEDMVEYYDQKKWLNAIKKIAKEELKPLIVNYHTSKIVNYGFKIGIIGRPNVGKSSLLNALLKKERAIVTNFPGTTRDVIEDHIKLENIDIFLYDTAGIRESNDLIEKIGVQKTREVKERCDLIIFMVDAKDPFNAEDLRIHQELDKTKVLYVINKIDLIDKNFRKELCSKIQFTPSISISALSVSDIEIVEKKIIELISQRFNISSHELIAPNLRQFSLLQNTYDNVDQALDAFYQHQPEDIIIISLEEAVKNLGNVLGIDIEQDIMDNIFDNFCIGK
jgi:tRNA modification GTPase